MASVRQTAERNFYCDYGFKMNSFKCNNLSNNDFTRWSTTGDNWFFNCVCLQSILSSEIFTEWTSFLEALAMYCCSVVLPGDSNINMERSDDVHTIVLFVFFWRHSTCQHVKETTQNDGGCLDLIITRSDCRAEWDWKPQRWFYHTIALSPVVCRSKYPRSR